MKSESINLRIGYYDKEYVLKICEEYKLTQSELIIIALHKLIESDEFKIDCENLKKLRENELNRIKSKTRRKLLRSKMHFPKRASNMLMEAIYDNCANEHIIELIDELEKEALTYDDDIILKSIKELRYIDLDNNNWRKKLESQIKIIKGLKCEIDENEQ